MGAKYRAGTQPLNDEIIRLRSAIDVRAIMAAAGVASPDLLMPHIQTACRFTAATHDVANGPIRVEVPDKQGNVRLQVDGSPVTLPQQLEEWRILDPSLSRALHEPLGI